MQGYPPTAKERAMKMQEVLVQAIAGQPTWIQAADVLGISPRTMRRWREKYQSEHGSGLGKTRWVVERSLSWLHQFRRLRIRWERRADIHEAFLSLACILICCDFAVRLL